MPSGPRSFLRLSLGARRKEFCPGSLPRSTVGSLAPRLPPSPPSPHVPFGLSPCRAGPGQRGPGRLHSPHSPRAFAGPPSEPAHLAHFVPSVILTPFGLRSYRSAPHFARFLHSLPASVTLVSSVCLSALLSVRSSFTSVSSGSFLTSRSERSTRQTKDDECDAETRDVGRLVWLLSSCPNLRATPRRSFVTSVSSLVVPPGESDRPSASRYACPTHPAGRIE